MSSKSYHSRCSTNAATFENIYQNLTTIVAEKSSETISQPPPNSSPFSSESGLSMLKS